MDSKVTHIQLEELAESADCLTEATASHLSESCVVTLESHTHVPGVGLTCEFQNVTHDVRVSWGIEVTETMRRCHRDSNKRIDNAACAIALMLVPRLTGYRGYEQSATGDRIDYHLRAGEQDDTLIFNSTMKLEVSGIDRESTTNTVVKRVKEKKARLDSPGGPGSRSDSTYICVVEFSNPKSAMVLT